MSTINQRMVINHHYNNMIISGCVMSTKTKSSLMVDQWKSLLSMTTIHPVVDITQQNTSIESHWTLATIQKKIMPTMRI